MQDFAFKPLWSSEDDKDIEGLGEKNPAFGRMVRRIPPNIRQTFSAAQFEVISEAMQEQKRVHTVDFRVSVPFMWRRFYITLFAGEERRSSKRLAYERQLNAVKAAIAYIAAIAILFVFAGVPLFFFLYLAKSIIGIDLIEGPGTLPGMFGLKRGSHDY